LWTGSTFPLVETALRMVLRVTLADVTGTESSRDMNEARMITPMAALIAQRIQRLAPAFFALWVSAISW
jgi:hypothetical protein